MEDIYNDSGIGKTFHQTTYEAPNRMEDSQAPVGTQTQESQNNPVLNRTLENLHRSQSNAEMETRSQINRENINPNIENPIGRPMNFDSNRNQENINRGPMNFDPNQNQETNDGGQMNFDSNRAQENPSRGPMNFETNRNRENPSRGPMDIPLNRENFDLNRTLENCNRGPVVHSTPAVMLGLTGLVDTNKVNRMILSTSNPPEQSPIPRNRFDKPPPPTPSYRVSAFEDIPAAKYIDFI